MASKAARRDAADPLSPAPLGPPEASLPHGASAEGVAREAREASGASGAGPLRLEYRTPAELAENPNNWREHPAEQMAALDGLIGEVGWAGACLFNERTGRLIDGHARRKRAIEKGESAVPVLIGSWSEADEAKILATLDPVAGMAAANAERLAVLLAEVETESEAVMAMLEELAEDSGCPPTEAAADGSGAGGDEFDPAPEEGPTRTKPGEVWVIGGKHRLFVGDSAECEKLKLTDKYCTILDPPYEAGESVWLPFLRDPCILFGLGKHLRHVPEDLYRFERVIDKVTRHRCATTQVGSRHALVVQVGSVKKLPRSKATFDSIVQNEIRENHPHEKPVSLIAEHLSAWTPAGSVFDPFAGSGASLIAAHRTKRQWFGCEREPAFADVILRRAEAEEMTVERS